MPVWAAFVCCIVLTLLLVWQWYEALTAAIAALNDVGKNDGDGQAKVVGVLAARIGAVGAGGFLGAAIAALIDDFLGKWMTVVAAGAALAAAFFAWYLVNQM